MNEFTAPIPVLDPEDKEYKAFLEEFNKTLGKDPFDLKMILALRQRAYGPGAK